MKEEMNEEKQTNDLGRFLYRKCQDHDISLSAIPPELEKKWTQEYYASIAVDYDRTAADDSRTDDDGRTDDDDVLLLIRKGLYMQKVIIYTDGACSGNPGPRWMGSSAHFWRI